LFAILLPGKPSRLVLLALICYSTAQYFQTYLIMEPDFQQILSRIFDHKFVIMITLGVTLTSFCLG